MGQIGMNLNQLRVFFVVARENNFTRGAHLLNITQPAASIRIRQLESEYGTQLFERVGRKVVLTDAGETLFGYAQRIFSLVEEAEHALENARDLKSGQLKIGAGHTVVDFISPILNRFKIAYPGVVVRVILGNSQKVLDDVLKRRVDVGILAKPQTPRGLASIPFFRESLVLVLSRGHPWQNQQTVDLKAVHGKPLIVREPGSGTRALIEAALQDVGAVPHIAMELPTNEAIKKAVASGIGIALMPRSVVQREINSRRLVAIRIRNHPLIMDINWSYLQDREDSRILRALFEIVSENSATLDAPLRVPARRKSSSVPSSHPTSQA